MLLAIADPFRLVDGAIEDLYRFLCRNAELCRLTAGIGGDAKADGLFLLRSDGDLPPTLFGRAQLNRAGEVPYTLDATPLIRLLEQPKDASGESVESYAKWLLPRFKAAWERASPRKQVNKKARVAGGFEAICYLLSPAGHDALTGGEGPALGIEVQELEDEEATAYTLETWSIVNESVNGFMLSHPDQAGLGIRVGDLVLIVPELDKTPQPVVAVVRWFGSKERTMQCGVEILPGHPTAITMETVLPNPELPRGPGLYLPAVKSIQAPPTLVAPKGLHKPMRNLRVDIGSKKQTVSCGEVLTATEYIDRFRFGRA
jgi:hypothetical protein